jgi:hypothetical protein
MVSHRRGTNGLLIEKSHIHPAKEVKGPTEERLMLVPVWSAEGGGADCSGDQLPFYLLHWLVWLGIGGTIKQVDLGMFNSH